MKNTLKLRKCAYLFHWTANNFTCSMYADKKRAINQALKAFYDDPTKLEEEIPYTTDARHAIIIDLAGYEVELNDLQIAAISDPENVINHRRIIDVEKAAAAAPSFHIFCGNSLYSNKFKSLYFEFYTEPERLGYIRVHFKGNCAKFIIDNRNGDIFTSGEHGRHAPVTVGDLIAALDIGSAAARKEFFEVIRAIKNGGVTK